MKKILLVFALLLLAGCLCPYLLGGSKDVLELVPKSANVVLIVRPSAILNDSDLSSLYNYGGTAYNKQRIETTTGIDPTKIDRIVLFTEVNSLKSTDNSYGAFIARGTMDKNTVLDKMRVDNYVTQLSYGGQDLYEISSKQSPGDVSYFSFLDSSTLVGGTKEAVEDSIDTNAGKMDSVKTRQNLSQIYDALDKNSLIILLMDIPQQMKREISQSLSSQPNFQALSQIDCIGLSAVKNSKNINIKMLVTADDASSATDVSDAFDKGLSTLKGVAPAGSTIETIANKLSVDAKGVTVTVNLQTTSNELNSLIGELSSLGGANSQGGTGAGDNGSSIQGIILPG
ncbi:hypothetical protein H0N99_04450 [Candidatus Micrarchaeota archaeon]|nr:hypothetical protein [Candidatus Micrarchaeota archaeon]